MKKVVFVVAVLLVAALGFGAAYETGAMLARAATTRAYVGYVGQVVGIPAKVTGNAKTYCVAITASDADTTLDTSSDYFRICAIGNTAYLTFKATAPAVDHTVGNFDVVVGDGQCHVFEITEATVAVIGESAAGFACFYPLVSPGGKPS